MPTASEVQIACSVRLKMSLPEASVPNRWTCPSSAPNKWVWKVSARRFRSTSMIGSAMRLSIML